MVTETKLRKYFVWQMTFASFLIQDGKIHAKNN